MKKIHLFIALSASAVLTACTYSELHPESALKDIRNNNGYYDLQEIEPGTAKIVVRATGTSYPAHFSISTSSQACQGFKPLGEVAYTGRGVVYPWIANWGSAVDAAILISRTTPSRVNRSRCAATARGPTARALAIAPATVAR